MAESFRLNASVFLPEMAQIFKKNQRLLERRVGKLTVGVKADH